jgi:glycosyltransferase involved in cell wall biosynthesis
MMYSGSHIVDKHLLDMEEDVMDENLTLDISVVLPVYNEAENIGSIIKEIVQVLEKAEILYEVVVVDDGSDDQTLDVLRDVKQTLPEILRVAHHLSNKGNGAALRTGIRVARGEVVVTMDADGQHSGGDISKLLLHIPPYDLVIGSRTEGYQGSWYRGVANNFYNRFASWLSGTEVIDLTSGFRAMRRDAVLHFLPLFPNGFSAPTTTTLTFLKAGYNVIFVPIEVGRRIAGESKISIWRDGMRFIMIILRMIMLYDPLRIFLISGGVLSLLGLLAWIAGLINAGRLVFPNSAIFLFSTAILTWLLGLVSDQITSTRIHYYGDESVLMIEE